MLIFATTVFLSAFLLFQIQPIVAKMILPWFGGSSSVWSVCLVFFQAELLLGYAYVHWMHEKLQPHRQMVLHGAVLLLSLLTLPVVADAAWLARAPESPSLAVLLVLATTVGAPYLLLSTTGPLMQAWYARSSLLATSGVQPYRLYALSNLASMLGLLTYPVLVEPVLALRPQALVWSTGYAVFVLACLGTAAVTWHSLPRRAEGSGATAPDDAPRPTGRECALWVGLAATATVLLLSITRHLTQDVAPVPFLWVLPLALYLLSFILCFDASRYYVRPAFLAALPLAFLALDRVLDSGMPVLWLIALLCSALFVFCMVCHGELVRRKPPVRHLTLFYLMLSIGGALGGAFVGLLAPAVFNAYYELPIGLFACAALVAVVLWPSLQRHWRVLLLLALLAYGARLLDISLSYVQGYKTVMRNFYSQLRVEESTDAVGPLRSMVHGRINHGEQYLQEPHRRQPTAYYCELSGIGRALRSLPQDRPLRLGVVGLGTGTLAAYGRPGDVMRLYEINDQVLSLARTDFTYLQDSGATIETALGDGRLVLEAEPPQRFDLLAMDAFSGDSIPTHLLTLEAMQGYLRHLAPQGVLAVHITNRYLDLKPVMASAAQALGRVALAYELTPPEGDLYCRRSTWVLLLTPEQASALPPALVDGVRLPVPADFRPWTDSFSNLLGILKR